MRRKQLTSHQLLARGKLLTKSAFFLAVLNMICAFALQPGLGWVEFGSIFCIAVSFTGLSLSMRGWKRRAVEQRARIQTLYGAPITRKEEIPEQGRADQADR